jgi:hypothetical protein
MSFDEITQPASTGTEDGSSPESTTDATRSPVVEKEKDPYADNFARLIRREKQLRERESKHSDYEKQLSEYRELQDLAKKDPFKYLERSGLTFDELSRKLIEDPITPEKKELQELKEKMTRWEQEREEDSKSRKEKETQSAYETAKQELQSLLDKEPEKYELVRMQNAHELVFQVIYEYQKQNGKWLNFDEAAGKVEAHLEKDVERLLESKKLRSKLAPKIDESPEDSMGTQSSPATHGASPTLSNFNANQTTPRADGRVSDEELMKRAMRVMQSG